VTWLSVAAAFLFVISGLLACCIPKPLPIVVRVKNSLEDDETDGCCAICVRGPKEEEGDKERAPDEEKGDVVADGGSMAQTGAQGKEVRRSCYHSQFCNEFFVAHVRHPCLPSYLLETSRAYC